MSRSAAPASFDPTLGLEDARTAALREVNRIIATPDDVARLDTIRADAVTRRLNAEAALSSALGAQVAETMSGRSRLEACQEALRLLQQRFREIDALCVECRDLVQHDDVIRQLSTVRANFEATLSKVVTILDLPEEAAQTLASLEQESELVVVYEELVALDAKCAAAQRLFEDGAMQTAQQRSKASSRARNEELKSRVASYFQKVDAARFTFEDRMWAQLKEAVHLGDSGSATCVRVLRVVQEQEAMDGDRAKQKPGTALPWAPRKYRQLAVQAVEAAVDERCARLLPEHLVPPDGEDSVVMAEVLLDVQECFRGLEDIYDFIVPCFPEDYGMWEVFVRRYHIRLVQFYDRVSAMGQAPSNSDILDVVRSHEEYTSMLADLSTPAEWYAITPVPLPYEPEPEPQATGKGRRKPKNTREAVAAAEADARERAKAEAAAQGGNWEGAAVVPVDQAARALLTGLALDTAGLTLSVATGVVSGTVGMVKGAANLVASGISRVGGGGAGEDAEAQAAAAAEAAAITLAPAPVPKRIPSKELWVPGTGYGLDRMVDVYVRRMRDSTATWIKNMVSADLNMAPSQEESGRLWTPAGVDFFRSVNEQLEAVTAVTRGELLVRVVVAISKLMLDFQKLQNEAVDRPMSELSLETLCAYVNNNSRCYDLSNEVLDQLREIAPDETIVSRLEVLEVTDQGFLETARAAMKKAVDAIFGDPGFASVFAQLFAHPDWWSGGTCDTLCATLMDYFGDLQSWLCEGFFKRSAEAVMERCVGMYCAALFMQCKVIRTDSMARMAADEQALREVFAPFVKPQALASSFQALSDLRELASASSEFEIAKAFDTMMTNTPGTTPDVVERIMVLRDDIPKAVKKQIVGACHDQWAQRTGAQTGGLAVIGAAIQMTTSATAEAIQNAIKQTKSRWFS